MGSHRERLSYYRSFKKKPFVFMKVTRTISQKKDEDSIRGTSLVGVLSTYAFRTHFAKILYVMKTGEAFKLRFHSLAKSIDN